MSSSSSRAKGLNQSYCAHRKLFLLETIFTALNVICETCRTTLPAFHINKQRLADLNDREEHDVRFYLRLNASDSENRSHYDFLIWQSFIMFISHPS